MRRQRWWVVVLVAVLVGCGGPPASPSTTPDPGTPSPTSSAGPSGPTGEARIVATERVADRQVDLTVESPAVGGPVRVRLLVPAGYREGDTTRRPSLYLLHGCCDTYVSWTRSTDIAELSQDEDLFVVMPDGGPAGFYSDWRSGPQWEQFHLVELPRLLAAAYGVGEPRAVVGVSMGGLGALGYAARHPGMFRLAASFSGIVHTRLTPDTAQGYLGLVSSQGEDPYALWGDPETDADVWREHNPYDLVARLAGTRVYVSCGNGEPGPLDKDQDTYDGVESGLSRQNAALAKRLKTLKPAPTVNLYGAGTHNWVYWNRELTRVWPSIVDELQG